MRRAGGAAAGGGALNDADALRRLKDALVWRARSLGFAELRVTTPSAAWSAGERLRAWVADGRHGEMAYMAERLDWRADPTALWPDARAVVMVADSYGPDVDPLAALTRKDRGAISVYAQGADYHDVLKKRLKALGRWLMEQPEASPSPEIKVFVDTAPVMEKPLAEAAGLGWIGKHANLVSRRIGNWFFLGALFTTVALPPDEAEGAHCGGCRRCLDICPTAAFTAPFQLDARRCVSYLTIELKDQIPRGFRAPLGNRIYGCDDCLAVCPWNKFARVASEAKYWARVELRAPKLAHLAALDDASFRDVFRGSPIKRIGRDRFVRNVLVAVGNSGDAALAPVAAARLDDASALVRGMAVWALARLDRDALCAAAPARLSDEADASVRAEWRAEGFTAA